MVTGETNSTNQEITKADQEERMLNPSLSAKLTEIREMELTFHEKARRYAGFLKEQGCTDVVIIDCDVCVDEYLPSGKKLIDVIRETEGKRDLDCLSEQERRAVFNEIDKRLPEECKVRVQATTAEGYHTFCFDCDSTMCENEVDYLDNPNWDELHDKEAQDFLKQHPELAADRYLLWGSTRRYICVNILSEDPTNEADYKEFALPDGRRVRISYYSREMINMMGQDASQFILDQYRKLNTQISEGK